MSRQLSTAKLLITCQDKPGIIAAVTNFLALNKTNIVHADQHSMQEENESLFFMRLVFEYDPKKVAVDQIQQSFEKEVASDYGMQWHIFEDGDVKKIAILASKTDHCLLEILWRWRSGEINADIPIIISNHSSLESEVKSFNIPFHHLPIVNNQKEKQEEQVIALLKNNDIDLVILARYMQILSKSFIDEYQNNIINIHHSFLPAFVGADPYGQAIDRGVKVVGATAHYATENLDQGPIIEQDVIRLTHRDDRRKIIELGKEVERSVLARAVKWHLEDKVFIVGNKTIVFN
ncbi:MAG: formyltetrahydrofolate deformylase [Dehalococcoidia bacterium]|nr:formyltetrahydrofolate deformylase [Dehalococcoidia bacterium]